MYMYSVYNIYIYMFNETAIKLRGLSIYTLNNTRKKTDINFKKNKAFN